MGEAETLSLASTSDLVVKCPWTPGIIEADEPLLPQSRLAITFRILFQLRKRSRESLQTAFADPIERLEQIHSFRLAAEDDGLRLAVTYDFGWESYMRSLKEKGGPLMDLLCCHCAGYPLARHSPLPAWQAWIAKNQVQSDYFYSATSLTVCDLAALTQAERVQRDEADLAEADRVLAGLRSASADQVARAARRGAELAAEAQHQAMLTVLAMYGLTRFWTADVVRSVIPKDAITLVLAARAMLQDQFVTAGSFNPVYEQALATALEWYRQPIPVEPARPAERPLAPAALAAPPAPAYPPADVQRGIVSRFDDPAPISHGAAVFLAVTDRHQARIALAGLTLASEAKETGAGEVFRNLAFTHSGLRRLGLATAVLQAAPRAFRDGAAARAGSVGDVRSFHPSNWRPLRRNWEPMPEWEVDVAQVDVLIQLRVAKPGAPTDLADPAHPLRAAIAELAQLTGLELLAVEGLAPAGGPGSRLNHLGFEDGMSQPVVDGPPTKPWSDRVEAGALLVGRDGQPVDSFWRDGSFLAVRRMPIDATRFRDFIGADAKPKLNNTELLAAKLLGRGKDGKLLDGTAADDNNFNFEKDKYGAVCPLDSHIRRANPRVDKPPRIMRRGMSFGPPIADANANGAERGSYFMAYCADLAEQYERVLAWVNGGNSTRIGSYRSDPMTGVPEPSPRTFKFVNKEGEKEVVHRLELPDAKNGAISLTWSLYLFAPSLPAVAGLADTPPVPAAAAAGAERGRLIIASLQRAGADATAWRSVLNESGARELGYSQDVWAAIRADSGILDSPAGYLVGSYDLVMEVLRDDGHRFSNRGAGGRIEETVGRFHLGLDPYDEEYKKLSGPANDALRLVHEDAAFELTRATTKTLIKRIFEVPGNERGTTIDLLTNLIEPVMAAIARPWFDVPDEVHVAAGPHDWKVDTPVPRYPGDFWAPSRYAFNPFTSRETVRMAVADGKATVEAVTKLIGAVGRDKLAGTVSRKMGEATDAYPDDAALARTLVGCMIGGVPTVALNAIKVLIEGIETWELDRAQRPWLLLPEAKRTFDAAHDSFAPRIVKKLQSVPVPELLWRLVARDRDSLGRLPLDKGRTLIFSLESAGLDQQERGIDDNYIPFGQALPKTPPTPHGCPARDMANGIVLGLLVGLLESARFRPFVRGAAEIRPLA